jgi:hypothetical protein
MLPLLLSLCVYNPADWFQHLFGFRESVTSVYSHLSVVDHADHSEIISRVNGRHFRADKFSVRNLSSFPALQPIGGGTLNVLRGHGADDHRVNALSAQSLPENDGATFQAASNFNCLELMSAEQTAADGVTGYVFDNTQGPALALAAGPAAVYRNYFVKHADGREGQLDHEIELLARSPLRPFVKHGYPQIDRAASERLAWYNWSDLSQFAVGVHEGCEITTTISGGGYADAPAGRITHQVFAAALNFARDVVMTDSTLEVARALLAGEYRATVIAAWELSLRHPDRAGSKRLYLTFLGGGVFGNPRNVICEAISGCADLIVQSGLQVYVVCFSENAFAESIPYLRSAI